MQAGTRVIGLAPALLDDASGHPAPAGDLAHAQMRQAPLLFFPLQQRGAEQPIVEAAGDQRAAGKPGLDQRFGAGMGGEIGRASCRERV